MAAHHHIFVGILAATDDAEDVVIFHRAGEEVVADVELQLEILTVHHFLLDNFELMLVKQDVAGLGQIVHSEVEAGGAVVEHLHRKL